MQKWIMNFKEILFDFKINYKNKEGNFKLIKQML